MKKFEFRLQVTQKHIDEGVRSTCTRCPIALALADWWRGYNPDAKAGDFVSVFPRSAFIRDGHGGALAGVKFPDLVDGWIRNYDRGARPYPINVLVRAEVPDAA